MCHVNHNYWGGDPGYLIRVRCESMASGGVLFTRTLANYREVGLSPEQIMGLLDLSREYHDKQGAIRAEFARITERLELKWDRVDSSVRADRADLLERHAELFKADEELFFEYAQKGHDLLSDEQIDRAEMIYHNEKNQGLTALADALNNAVGPAFTFQSAPVVPVPAAPAVAAAS